MAKNTEKVIIDTFKKMLDSMPFEKITVTALIKECNIGRNTFYYHYENIDALLNDVLLRLTEHYKEKARKEEWHVVLKEILHTCCDNRKKVLNLYNSVSRERLEQYIFVQTDDSVSYNIMKRAGEKNAGSENIKIVTDIVRYSLYGFFMRFLITGLKDDIDESVDRLVMIYEELMDHML